MVKGRALTFALCVACIASLPFDELKPHNDMYGISPRAGTDAVEPDPEPMVGVVECDGELGAKAENVNIWPSPEPLPSPSPVPSWRPIVIVPVNLSSNANMTQPKQPPTASPLPKVQCEDDEAFIDSKGLNCRDYTMNRELCRTADRFVNRLGKSARHACCKCGGGKHVSPIPTKKCVRDSMGGEEGCTEEKFATLGIREQGPPPALGRDDFDTEMTRKMGGGNDYDQVVVEDEIEENALDSLGTVSSMDGVLEPDSIVFRERNFIGYPREPDSSLAKSANVFAVVGTVRFSLPFEPSWEATYGSRLISALSIGSGVQPHGITLTGIRPGSVVVDYRIIPDDPSRISASHVADTLRKSLEGGSFATTLASLRFPKADVTLVVVPHVEEVVALDGPSGFYNPREQYSTVTYVVGPRETFTSIAEKFHIRPSVLVAFNEDVADPYLIKAGDVLLVPVPRVVQVKHMSTQESALEGGTEIVVKGTGFVYPAFCKFGDRISSASYVVEDTLVCSTPEQKEPGFYPFSISDGKGGFVDTTLRIRYHVGMIPFCDEPGARPSWCRPRMAIFSVAPTRVPQDTGVSLQIIGAGFNSSSVCVVGGVKLPTTVWSRTNLTCEFPPSPPGVNAVVVVQSELQATTQYDVVVFSTLSVTKLDPANGPEQGGTTVFVTGTTFKTGAFCRFGDIMVSGVLINSTLMRCVAPPSDAKVVQLDVSNDGRYFSASSVPYEYTYLRLSELSQKEGRVEGGDVITLTGYGFYPNMWCRFGSDRTMAEHVNLTTARCMSPPQNVSAVVRVALSLDGLKQWTEDEVYFEYFSDLTELRPVEGRSIGGDDIHVFGHGFDPFSSYSCRFGVVSVPAVVITPSQLQCTSPPGVGTVDFALESKTNHFRTNAVGQKLQFTYHGAQDIDIFGIFPSHTDVRTPNTTVLLKGFGFTPGTLCRFGDKVSLSTFVDSKTIKCAAPMRDLAELVPVFVSHDGGNSWSGTLAYFEYRAVVTYMDMPLGRIEGGETVRVTGYGFNFRVSLCVFGNVAVTATVTNQFELACVVPPSEAAARVPFAVTCNSSILYDPYLEFQFKNPGSTEWGTWYVYAANPSFYVKAITPAVVSTMGGVGVLVEGEGFDKTVHCVFGDATVKAQFLDAATVRCISPPHSAGKVEFSVVVFNQTEGYNVSALGTGLSFAPPLLRAVTPSGGYVTGGERVVVSGDFLTGAVSCRFGKAMVPAVAVSDAEVHCVTPPVEVTSGAPVQLVFGGGGSSTGDVVFSYHPVVTSVSPQAGYILTTGQVVTIRGEGFAGDPTQCVFDSTEFVPATIVSNTAVTCVVPLRSSPRTVPMWLTSSRQSEVGGHRFNFKYNHVIQNLHPTSGSTTGGTTVVAVGSGFSSVTHCSFDGALANATVVSDMMVRCTSPFHPPGSVSFSLVSSTGVDETIFISNPVEFSFKIMSTHVDTVYPTAGSTGGGALVTVRGSGFTLGSFCRFGEVEVPVVYFSPDHVACYSPPVSEPKTVSVEVSQIGGGEGFSQDGHSFTYHANVSTVNRIDPDFGAEGDDIVVTGYGFTPASICYFGGTSATSTRFISEAQLMCTAPPMGTKSQEIVQVTSDPTHLPGGHVIFQYELPQSLSDTIAVRLLAPSEGPSVGGTLVTVYGVNFPSQALCRFGDLYVEARHVSDTELQCTSPQHRAATVVVEVVTADKSRFSSSFVRYTYQAASEIPADDLLDSAAPGEPYLESVTPRARPGDSIELRGQLFSSVGFCVFRDAAAVLNVEAEVVDSARVVCQVPQPLPSFGETVTVSYVSISGLSSQSLPFTFVVG